MDSAIDALLRPQSIAILGASADFEKLNGRTLKALLDKGYAGKLDVAALCPLLAGRGIGFITRSGGAGAVMADRAEELGLDVATLTEETTHALKEVVPAFGATSNPIDITAQGLVDPSIMRGSLKIVLADPNVDIVVVWLAFTEKHAHITVQTFAEAKSQTTKRFVVSWVGIPDAAAAKMREHGIAVLRGAESAVDAAAALVRHAEARRNWLVDSPAREALSLPELALPRVSGAVASLDARALLECAGVRTVDAELVTSADAAVAGAERTGYPVALKIESPDILHKTEAQGVKLGLKDAAAVREAFQTVVDGPRRYKSDARISGALVQPMAQGEVELVIGLKRDANFGVVVMVGLGGIHIEVLKDVVFRQAPVTVGEADRMLGEVRSKAVLEGVRGRAPVDRAALTRMISAASRFGAAAGERLVELDLNPVLCSDAEVAAVDWLLVLDTDETTERSPVTG
jgi:acetyltransferase